MEPVEQIADPGDRAHAPGRLRLVQEFTNTVDNEHGREVLASPDRLRDLLVRLGLVEPATRVTRADLARAVELRAALRSLASANNGGHVDAGAPATLERAAAAGRLTIRFDPTGAAELVGAAPGVAGALGTLVAIVQTAIADGTWPRVKACRRDVCQWLFYDRSRNRAGTWCHMTVCGNRTKTRAYRRRRGGAAT